MKIRDIRIFRGRSIAFSRRSSTTVRSDPRESRRAASTKNGNPSSRVYDKGRGRSRYRRHNSDRGNYFRDVLCERIGSSMSLALGTLIKEYQIDPDSSFHELKHEVRVKHRRMLARIAREKGEHRLRDIRARTLVGWQRDWAASGKAAMASALTGRLSALFRFGATILEDRECARLFEALSLARVQAGSTPRIARMTADQATALRNKAREIGYFSIALAQALQFELRLPG